MRTTCTLPRVMYALETDLSFGARADPVLGGDVLSKRTTVQRRETGVQSRDYAYR